MWKEIKEKKGIHTCPQMDMHLSSLGFTDESVKYLKNPCQIHDKGLLNDLKEAVAFIKDSISNDRKIVIIGDYDADGVTSTSVLYLALDFCNADVDYIIPHRIRNGYGMSVELVDVAVDMGAQIILTCDNGIAAIDAVSYARNKGLDVIISDHHTPGDVLPDANYIIHPALGDYPFPYISGCQTAYKLAIGIIEECNPANTARIVKKSAKKKEKQLMDYLFQLSSLSIVTDVMPIASSDEELAKVNENRKWLMDGIEMMRKNPDWHIGMMMDMLGINQKTFDEQSIGFYLGPCLNAVGRLDDAKDAVKFLTEMDENEAKIDFSFMMFINEERKALKKDAMNRIAIKDEGPANIILEKGIHEGLIGILAGTYMNDTGKTSIVMTDCEVDGKPAWKGSARGTGEVSLYDILSKLSSQSSCIYAFGGHADAAGLTVLDEDIEEFKEGIERLMTEALKNSTYAKRYIVVNGRKEREELVEAIKDLKPFGNGLPLPVIELRYNVSEVDLYYKSGHAKTVQYEMEMSHGKKNFNAIELWMFGGIGKIAPLCDNRFNMTDNVQRIMDRDNLPEAEAKKIRAETYKRKKTENARVAYKIELGYTDFNGLGPRYNVLEVAF